MHDFDESPESVEFEPTPPTPSTNSSLYSGNVTDARPAGKTLSRLLFALSVLATALLFRFVLPYVVEELQYSATRGRQRAEHELAGERLTQVGLQQLSDAYQLIMQRTGPSVVHIDTQREHPTIGDGDPGTWIHGRPPEIHDQGSGVIVDASGFILTNDHVIRGADRIDVRLSDDRILPARVVGSDELTDLAVLQVDTRGLIAATWGDSDQLREGALVWAIGSPFGLSQSITGGIVSARNRSGLKSTAHLDYLQTDAAVNPGNSGGPLVDVQGRIVGINTAILGNQYQGVSFAIPSSIAREVYTKLRESGFVPRGWLGVSLSMVERREANRIGLDRETGVQVERVLRESPAEKAGVQAGDVIVRFDGAPIWSSTELMRRVAATEIGKRVELVVVRQAETLRLTVTVGEYPRST